VEKDKADLKYKFSQVAKGCNHKVWLLWGRWKIFFSK